MKASEMVPGIRYRLESARDQIVTLVGMSRSGYVLVCDGRPFTFQIKADSEVAPVYAEQAMETPQPKENTGMNLANVLIPDYQTIDYSLSDRQLMAGVHLTDEQMRMVVEEWSRRPEMLVARPDIGYIGYILRDHTSRAIAEVRVTHDGSVEVVTLSGKVRQVPQLRSDGNIVLTDVPKASDFAMLPEKLEAVGADWDGSIRPINELLDASATVCARCRERGLLLGRGRWQGSTVMLCSGCAAAVCGI